MSCLEILPFSSETRDPPEGFILDKPIEDSSYEENSIHRVIAEFDEEPVDTGLFRIKIPDLLHRITIWLQCVKGISSHDSVIGLFIGKQQWELITVSGRHILGKDIYRYTHAISRFTWREEHYLPRGVRWVERFDCPPQDDATLDPLDLALLIGMVQHQKERRAGEDEYTAHLVYTNRTLKELIMLLTATIPLQTLEAIEKEAQEMHSIHIRRGKVVWVFHAMDEQP